MELSILEKALLEDNRYFRSLFRASFFSVKVLAKHNLEQVSATGVIFLALKRNADNEPLKQYIDELITRMVDDNSLSMFDIAHQYCLSSFMQKALLEEEFYNLCKYVSINIDITDLAERIYGCEAQSFQRKRALNSLLLELSELKELCLYNLKWKVNTISKYTNRKFYDSIDIWLE